MTRALAEKAAREIIKVCDQFYGQSSTEKLVADIIERAGGQDGAESELKYAAQSALDWMAGAATMPELSPWVDIVTIKMLEVAIDHSKVEPSMPIPDRKLDGITEVLERVVLAEMELCVDTPAKATLLQAISELRQTIRERPSPPTAGARSQAEEGGNNDKT